MQIRKLDKSLKSNLAFHPRERRAKAEVTGPTKSKVPIVRASEIEAIRIGKPSGIAVGGGHDRDYRLALACSSLPPIS